MPIDSKRVQAIFRAAVEHQDPDDHAAILDCECASDVELRQGVESPDSSDSDGRAALPSGD